MSAMSKAQESPEALDALLSAPAYHSLVFENESVRVLETHVPPGDVTPLHTHRWPAMLHIRSWSDFVRRDSEGSVMVDSRISGRQKEGSVVWSTPLGPHTLENVGGVALQVLSIEIKGGARA
jgi:hypothetical protein